MSGRARWAGALALVFSAGWLSAAPAGQAPPAAARADQLVRVADEVAREVEQLRGWTFKQPVRKERIPLARARQDIRRMLLASDKPQHRARLQAFLRMAGLIPPDCDLLATSLRNERSASSIARTRCRRSSSA